METKHTERKCTNHDWHINKLLQNEHEGVTNKILQTPYYSFSVFQQKQHLWLLMSCFSICLTANFVTNNRILENAFSRIVFIFFSIFFLSPCIYCSVMALSIMFAPSYFPPGLHSTYEMVFLSYLAAS